MECKSHFENIHFLQVLPVDSGWGLKYLNQFLGSYQFWSLIKNTLMVSLTTIVFSFPIPILLAIVFNKIRSKRRQKMMQTVVYLPHFISVVVLVSIMTLILSPNSGILGQLAAKAGYSNVIMGDTRFLYRYMLLQKFGSMLVGIVLFILQHYLLLTVHYMNLHILMEQILGKLLNILIYQVLFRQ